MNLLTLLLKKKILEKERGKEMNCKKCGSPLTENDQFCKNCGATVNAQEEQGGVQSQSQQSSQSDMMQQQPVNNQQYQQPQQNYGSNNSNGWQNSYNPTPNFQQQKPKYSKQPMQ